MFSISLSNASAGATAAAGPRLGVAAEKQDQLQHAAEQFEAMLLARWWQQMRYSGFGPGEGEDPTYSAINATGLEAVTMAMARAGGIGLAKMLVQALEPEIKAEASNGQQNAKQRAQSLPVQALKSMAAEPITPVRDETIPERP